MPVAEIALPFAHLNLRRNPFGETDLLERVEFALIDVSPYVERLRKPGYAVQFLGEKGHGKTTHMIAIHAALPEAVYLHVGEGERPEVPESMPLLVDEMQRIPPRVRRRLFRRPVSFAITSHIDVAGEMRRWGLDVETVHVGADLDVDKLETILNRRIAWARRSAGDVPRISRATTRELLNQYGADLRAVEQHLYDVFQELTDIQVV